MFNRKNEDEDDEKRIAQIISREYKVFREQERLSRLPRTLYEKFCHMCRKIIRVEPDPASSKKMQEAIDFSHLRVTPSDVASATILMTFIICFPTFIALLAKLLFSTEEYAAPGLDLGQALFIIMVSMPLALYMYRYPFHLKKKYEMEAGGEIVTMVLYMAIYLRNMPNMEKAVEFASKNLTGLLGFELRKLMWDVEVGNYKTIEEALTTYARKWSSNRELVESLDLMVASLRQAEKRKTFF